MSFSVVVPTGAGRRRYLDCILDDLVGQKPRQPREIVVSDDAFDRETRKLVEARARSSRIPLRYVRREGKRGPNGARNTGIAATSGDVIVFVDDDCRFEPHWLAALDAGITMSPRAECYGGPIEIVLEPGHPRWCGREGFPITHLDHGPADRYVDLVYSANLAVRRRAFERVGPFDEEQPIYGDETEWLLRFRANGGLVRYVAAMRAYHTRFASDLSVRGMLAAATHRGRNIARFEVQQQIGRSLPETAGFAARMAGHAVRRRCWSAAAHAVEAATYTVVAARARGASRRPPHAAQNGKRPV